MKINDNLARVFDMEPIEGEVIMKNGTVIVPETNKQNEKIDYDYDKSRNNLHGLLASGQEALLYALDIAKSSEDPKAFDTVSKLLKTIADINTQMMDLHQRKQFLDVPKDVKKDETPQIGTVTNNNAIFVGSTSELNKMINKMNSGD
jgi:hypothetical protein